MRLATFTQNGFTRVGVVEGNQISDLGIHPPSPTCRSLQELLVKLDVSAIEASPDSRFPLASVRLEAPIPRPGKFLAIGLNYAQHVAEAGLEVPKFPVFFTKLSTCVNGPYDPIHLPRVSDWLDYEAELAIVIGRRCRHVPADRAVDVIAGYTIVNDVSVRDWQLRTPTMMMGKSFDTHGPTGPWIVTRDEIGDPHNLRMRTWVNDELRQDASTSDMIFNCYEQIEHLTEAFTLEPGDIISTGTPAGVGLLMKPPVRLVAGDTIRIEIEKIGHIENRIVPEPADTTVI